MSEQAIQTEGWYGPPNSRRYHYFRDCTALCGKWLAPVLAGENAPWDCAYGPANGDCAECKRKLALSPVSDVLKEDTE